MKTVFTYLTIIIVSFLLIGTGYFAAYLRFTKIPKFLLDQRVSSQSIGKSMSPDQLLDSSKSYTNSSEFLKNSNNILWDPISTMTPFLGYGPKPGIQLNSIINAMQFRSSKELKIPKDRNVFRIFLTGGSTAFSVGALSQDDTIGQLLEKILNQSYRVGKRSQISYEVYTFASPAWTSTHERIAIENRLSELEPDLVISFSGLNDIHWGIFGTNILWFRAYWDEFFWQIVNHTLSYSFNSSIVDVADKLSPISIETLSSRLLKNVQISSFVLNQINVPYVYFLQPHLAITKKILSIGEKKYLNDPTREIYFRSAYSMIRSNLNKKINSKNFHFFDLSTVFDNTGNDEPVFLDSYHFGDRGNKIIAENIALSLRKLLY